MENALLRKNRDDVDNQPTTNSYTPVQGPLNGSDIFFSTLLACQVEMIFGYPGGKVLSLYDRLLEYPGINHILVNHEQGAAHAAEAYARITGKPGVVLTTSGPGATNTVTGIADAFMDSVPLVVFSGQVEQPLIGKNAFQESNIVEITKPITKWNCQVRSVKELQSIVEKALRISISGKPGPVLVDIPKDIFNAEAEFEMKPAIELGKSANETPLVQGEYEQAARAISKAKRPVLYLGGGVISGEASELVKSFAINHQIPVTTTLMALGAFPENHELSLGMLGMHGTWFANMAVQECDVLIAVGARFDDRVTSNVEGFSPNSVKIHIDIDPQSINRNVKVDYPFVEDVQSAMKRFDRLVEVKPHDEWLGKIGEWKKHHPLKYKVNDRIIKPQQVIEKLSAMTNGDAVVVTDVGQHQMWAAQFYNFTKPRQFLTSGGLGTMGFGLPAAIGAALAKPEETVVCICGDGGFRMTSAELATAVRYRLSLKIFVLNNGCLGMVRQWQDFYFNERHSHSILQDSNPDFQKLAESYGALALRAIKPEELDFILAKAFSVNDRPVLVECLVDPEENVLPMVNPGACLHDMVE